MRFISRILIMLGCFLSPTAIPLKCMETPIPINNPLVDEGLTTISSDSPEFLQNVRKLLTKDAERKATDFLHSSFVIVNNTSRYLWGITVVYTYPDMIAPSGSPWRRIIHLEASSSDRARLLAPGATFLITPVSSFLASAKPSGERDIQPYLDEGLDRMIQLYYQNERKQKLTVSIDSLIWEDGTLVGPDSSKRMDTLNRESRADRELLDAFTGLHGDNLRKQLSLYSAMPATDVYTRRRSRRAQFLLNLYDKRGEPAAVTAIEGLRSQERFPGGNSGVKNAK